jgi:RNA polymerase sigma-70 factor (ECF subfamily)
LTRVYTYVYYRTGNVHDAEDLTERVFFQALTYLPSYKERGLPFSAWLLTIAHNLVANWHRDRRRHPVLCLDDVVSARSLSAEMEESEEREMLRKAIAGLPRERQHLLLLKFVEEMPNAEIGRVMNRSEGAVKALLHRTLRSLAVTLRARENGRE